MSDSKVMEMGSEIKQNFRGQTKYGLWGSHVKTWKYLPGVNFLYFFELNN